MPCGLDVLAKVLLFLYACWGLFRVGRFVLRRLLWRIRTRLIVSYLFIAVVPVVLLLLLFALATLLFSGLVASHIVTAELEARAAVLQASARSALRGRRNRGDRPPDRARAGRPSRRRLRGRAGRAHRRRLRRSPGDAAVLGAAAGLRRPREGGRDRRAAGDLAERGGLRRHRRRPSTRACSRTCRQRMGIAVHGCGRARGDGRLRHRHRHRGHADHEPRGRGRQGPHLDRHPRAPAVGGRRRRGRPSGLPLRPLVLGRRLSPSALNVADLLVKLLALVAVGVFLVVYVVALLVGLAPRALDHQGHPRAVARARSGCARGDFTRPIRVYEPRPAGRARGVVQRDGGQRARPAARVRRTRSGWRRSCASPARSR